MTTDPTPGAGKTGPVALITGGGTGIGAATAQRLASGGWNVVVTGRRNGPIEQLASEVGGLAVVADQSVEADCLRVVDQTIETYGRLDALVVNAGVEAFGSAEEVALDDWASVMKVNVDGPLLMARAAAPDLRANRGSIVLVSSVAGLAAGPKYAAYVTSKTAVLGLARSLAVDLGSSGVRVNALCPGWVDTDAAFITGTTLVVDGGGSAVDVDTLAYRDL